MSIAIPRSLVDFVLLGPTDDRRQLQDSPILGEVWVAFAKEPEKSQELLITPHKLQPAGAVALAIDEQIQRQPPDIADIAPLQGVVAARLYFEEVLRVVTPMTDWWHNRRVQDELRRYQEKGACLDRAIKTIVDIGENWKTKFEGAKRADLLPAFDRSIALAGLILWARDARTGKKRKAPLSPEEALAEALNTMSEQDIRKVILKLFENIQAREQHEKLVWQISLNRTATPAVDRSVPAVKGDAARTLFTVNCSRIAWAVIDSGIQGDHVAFKDPSGKDPRVKGSFDFTNIRRIVSLDNLKILSKNPPDKKLKAARLKELLRNDLRNELSEKDATELLTQLANDAKNKRALHWELVRPFVEIHFGTRPEASDHGSHVAGIIGASKKAAEQLPDETRCDYLDGMCPDIQLYDFRVLAPNLRETEFAIIAALQFIRYLNGRTEHMTIHGANLSLSIPHDVRNYACGRTPVCVECERLVDSGVVVVAAAGNFGYQSFQTKEGSYESYAAFSITDPGNADGVITVGATHRYSPHTYGVSFFSSRGPTGDGRLKPDLVAPGERIRAPFREGWGDLDGTSMAAPHVSGAAAMLMARYSELIAQPRRVKSILCQSATDLGRERSFQGHGMLDVLRAFQSI